MTFFLHHCPGFNKESALWAQGLLHLLLLFYFQEGSQASYAESIREKLRCFRVHPSAYTWQRFRSQNAAYMKVAVDWRHFSSVEHYRQPSTFMYIGSTSQSVFRRESNRLSVAKKLLTGGEAQAELAIRYWVSNDCLQDFTLFLVTPCSSYRILSTSMGHRTLFDRNVAAKAQSSVYYVFFTPQCFGFSAR